MKRGFGTNFHSVYKVDPASYDIFSSSEYFSSSLMNRLRELFVGDIMLDVACGTCHKTNILSKFYKKVYALDASSQLLNYGMLKYGKNTKLNFILSSASSMPFLDKSIDTIFVSWGTFPLTKTLSEMKRVLSPEGVILRIGAAGRDDFTKLFPNFNMRRIRRIQKQFEIAGFTKEEYIVDIKFDTVEIAKNILNKIVGVDKSMIISNTLQHRIVLYAYKQYKK